MADRYYFQHNLDLSKPRDKEYADGLYGRLNGDVAIGPAVVDGSVVDEKDLVGVYKPWLRGDILLEDAQAREVVLKRSVSDNLTSMPRDESRRI